MDRELVITTMYSRLMLFMVFYHFTDTILSHLKIKKIYETPKVNILKYIFHSNRTLSLVKN